MRLEFNCSLLILSHRTAELIPPHFGVFQSLQITVVVSTNSCDPAAIRQIRGVSFCVVTVPIDKLTQAWAGGETVARPWISGTAANAAGGTRNR